MKPLYSQKGKMMCYEKTITRSIQKIYLLFILMKWLVGVYMKKVAYMQLNTFPPINNPTIF